MDAKSLCDYLHQHLQDSLREYVREKHRRQLTRLSLPFSHCEMTTNMPEPPKRLLTRSQASNYRPSLARSMSNIGLGQMDDIEEHDDECPSETTTITTTSSSSSMDFVTIKSIELPLDQRKNLYALSDIL